MKILATISVFVLSVSVWWGYQYWRGSQIESDPHLTWIESGIALQAFNLQDMEGKTFNIERLRNQWSIVFFGYTSCPDICPTTMLTLKHMLRDVPHNYQNTQVVLVSVDPKRDSQAKLKEYVKFYNDSFMGVRGAVGELQKFLNQLGAYYQIEDKNGDDYHVSHTASLFFIHPQGKMVAAMRPPHDVSRIAESYQRLRDYYGS